MCNCNYNQGFAGPRCYVRNAQSCAPRSSKRHTYIRHQIPTPIIGWCGKHTHPNLFTFKTNGSYAGRYRNNCNI